MFQSLINDIKHNFNYGNMVTRLVIINVAVFIVTALIGAFAPSFYNTNILEYIAVPGDPLKLLVRPWTLLTHMFVHQGLWHILWNMLVLYWFGAIVGDLINDRRIWPLYFLGALAGVVAFVIAYLTTGGYIGQRAIGASAGIMAIVAAAGAIAPDYQMRLILLGNVKLKYIVGALIFLDILASAGQNNAGGAIAHLGGAVFGFAFVYMLREGTDLSNPINRFWTGIGKLFISREQAPQARTKSPLTVSYRAKENTSASAGAFTPSYDHQDADLQSQVDQILEKIKAKGYDNLSQSEKDILHKASRQ